jgi:hypothetical protein
MNRISISALAVVLGTCLISPLQAQASGTSTSGATSTDKGIQGTNSGTTNASGLNAASPSTGTATSKQLCGTTTAGNATVTRATPRHTRAVSPAPPNPATQIRPRKGPMVIADFKSTEGPALTAGPSVAGIGLDSEVGR